ncbi:hypothetical protein HZB88_00985 [archaeon]|nr:hypothetical protein [archaeon]
MAVATGAELVILPAIIIGVIAGIIDLFFMLKDEVGSGGQIIGHGLGAFIPLLLFSFVSMNISYAQAKVPAIAGWNEWAVRGAVVLILAIVTYAKSSTFKGARGIGTHESFLHCLLVALIVGAGPWVWVLVKGILPESIRNIR